MAFTGPPSIEKPYVSTNECVVNLLMPLVDILDLLLMIRNCSHACEEFMHYLLSAPLAGGLSSGSRLNASMQAGSPTSSLPSTLPKMHYYRDSQCL